MTDENRIAIERGKALLERLREVAQRIADQGDSFDSAQLGRHLERFPDAGARFNEQLKQLTQAQTRADEQIRELKESQVRSDETIKRLSDLVESLLNARPDKGWVSNEGQQK